MTREEAQKLLPIIQAFANGEVIHPLLARLWLDAVMRHVVAELARVSQVNPDSAVFASMLVSDKDSKPSSQ